MEQKKLVKHLVMRDWCKGCGICVYFCPKKVLALDPEGRVCVNNPKDCVGCRLCEMRCPEIAIEIIDGHE